MRMTIFVLDAVIDDSADLHTVQNNDMPQSVVEMHITYYNVPNCYCVLILAVESWSIQIKTVDVAKKTRLVETKHKILSYFDGI